MRGAAYCTCLLLLLLGATAAADSVVLKNGISVSGTIVGREIIRAGGNWPNPLVISKASGEVQRFDIEDVECLIIDESDGPRIVRPSRDWRTGGSLGHSRSSVLLIGSGLAVGVVATVVPFGGYRLIRTADGDFVREVRYTGLNYALLGVGLATVVAGVVMNNSGDGEWLSSAPVIEPGLSPISGGLAITCCLRF